MRRRPEYRNHVWSYDFLFERTADRRPLKQYSRVCLAIVVACRLTSREVLACLTRLFLRYGVPEQIRSGNGPEFTARAVSEWLKRVGVDTLFIEPGSPWENGYVGSFNGKLGDECLNRERFDTLLEAQILIEQWPLEYNQLRPTHPSATGHLHRKPGISEHRPRPLLEVLGLSQEVVQRPGPVSPLSNRPVSVHRHTPALQAPGGRKSHE